MTLTKSLLIRGISGDTGFTLKKTADTLEILLTIIKETLASGETFRMGNFGKFYIQERKERLWRNPASGKLMKLPPTRIARFKSFKKLKVELNPQVLTDGIPELSRAARQLESHGLNQPGRLKEILENHRRWLQSGKKVARKAVLKNAALSHTDFYAAYLPQVNLCGADLRGADMSEADLNGANLQEANLADAVLTWAVLDEAKMRKASLEGADLRWANLEGADLTEANLRWANFEGANLREAKLFGADLYGANLKNTNMEDAVFTGITLDTETESKLPTAVTEKVRQTFLVTDWLPAPSPSG
jgi:nucleoid DNA-binding protein